MKIKQIAGKIVGIIQKILITVLLFFVYIVGFGMTVILMLIFKRKLLFGERGQKETYWQDAKGYEADMEECSRES